MNSLELENFANSFIRTNDSFRDYFSKYIPRLKTAANRIDNELIYLERTKDIELSMPTEDIVDGDIDWDTFDDVDWDIQDVEWVEDDSQKVQVNNAKKEVIENLDENNLQDFLSFINVVFELVKYKVFADKISRKLIELKNKKIIEEYFSDEEFVQDFDMIMEHDKKLKTYYFHGTQSLEDAYSILEQGLGMMQDKLESTTYREMSKEDIITYSRGFDGLIGRYAVVIIDVPNGVNVVQKRDKNIKINFVPSGLQGFGEAEYIIPNKYIVGFVDKENKKIVLNPNYIEYEKFSEQKRKTI